MTTIDTTLSWTPATDHPDADINVLAWVKYNDGTVDWSACFFDGVDWRECASGGIVNGVVLHYSQPVGPAC